MTTFNNNTFPNVTGTVGGFIPPPNPFMTPDQQRTKALEDRIAQLEAKLAEQRSDEQSDIDTRLIQRGHEGEKYLRAKYDGVTKIIMEWAMAMPVLNPKLTKFLDEWRSDALKFLESPVGKPRVKASEALPSPTSKMP